MKKYSSQPRSYWSAATNEEMSADALYKTYLKTDRWRKLKNDCFRLRGYCCMLCEDKATVAHHRVYPLVYGEENPNVDLVPLCSLCHCRQHPHPDFDEMRDELRKSAKNAPAGRKVECSLCGENANHKRKATINKSCVRFMKLLDETSVNGEFVHIREMKYNARNYPDLRHFGLIEPETVGMKTGTWRMRHKGKRFVDGEISVQSVCILDNNKPIRFEGKHVSVYEFD